MTSIGRTDVIVDGQRSCELDFNSRVNSRTPPDSTGKFAIVFNNSWCRDGTRERCSGFLQGCRRGCVEGAEEESRARPRETDATSRLVSFSGHVDVAGRTWKLYWIVIRLDYTVVCDGRCNWIGGMCAMEWGIDVRSYRNWYDEGTPRDRDAHKSLFSLTVPWRFYIFMSCRDRHLLNFLIWSGKKQRLLPHFLSPNSFLKNIKA